MLQNMLHPTPTEPDEPPSAPRTRADKWAVNIRAARRFHARKGSVQAARKHVERLTEPDGTGLEVRLGLFVDNARRRTDELGPERARNSTLSESAGRSSGGPGGSAWGAARPGFCTAPRVAHSSPSTPPSASRTCGCSNPAHVSR